MLVLSRKIGQSLLIGNGVRVCIVDVKGSIIRIGIEAPDDLPVVREELIGRPERPGQYRRQGGWPEAS